MGGMTELAVNKELGERAHELGGVLESFTKQKKITPDEMRLLFGRVNDLADADVMKLLANQSPLQGITTHRLREGLVTDLDFAGEQISPYHGPVTMVALDLDKGQVMAFYSDVDQNILREHYDSPNKPYSPNKLVAAALNKVLAEAALEKMDMVGGIESNRDFLNDQCGFGGLHRGVAMGTMLGTNAQEQRVGIAVSGAETVAQTKVALGASGEQNLPEFYFEGAGLLDEALARELWLRMFKAISRSAQDILNQRLTSPVKNPADN